MRRWRPYVLAGVLWMLAIAAPVASQARWGSDLQAGRRAAASASKPLLVDFAASWCGPCRMMEEQVFPDSRVKPLLERFVLVRLDVDVAKADARRYGVNAIPRLLVFPAGGEEPTLDLQGAREPEQFANELRSALGMKPVAGSAAPAENTATVRVRRALEGGTYSLLRTSDPKAAADGLAGLAVQLGASSEAEHDRVLALVRKAGDDAPPALIRGLGDRMLAVRAGCYRALQSLLPSQGPAKPPAFDPWAPAGTRAAQVQRWMRWWQAAHPAPRPPAAR